MCVCGQSDDKKDGGNKNMRDPAVVRLLLTVEIPIAKQTNIRGKGTPLHYPSFK